MESALASKTPLHKAVEIEGEGAVTPPPASRAKPKPKARPKPEAKPEDNLEEGPRLIHENERAPEGLTRFRIRGDSTAPLRYVLANDEAEAVAVYTEATKHAPQELVVIELPD